VEGSCEHCNYIRINDGKLYLIQRKVPFNGATNAAGDANIPASGNEVTPITNVGVCCQ
jgi:hypothetical protein